MKLAPTFTVTTHVSCETPGRYDQAPLTFTTADGQHTLDIYLLRAEIAPDPAPPRYQPRAVFDLSRVIIIQNHCLEILTRNVRGTDGYHAGTEDYWELPLHWEPLQAALLKVLDRPVPVDPSNCRTYSKTECTYTWKLASFSRRGVQPAALPSLVAVLRQVAEHSRANVLKALLYYRSNLEAPGQGCLPLPLDESGNPHSNLLRQRGCRSERPRWQRCLEAVQIYAQQNLHACYCGGEHYELGFNGRFAGGCGYNGGIILHGSGTPDASVGVHT